MMNLRLNTILTIAVFFAAANFNLYAQSYGLVNLSAIAKQFSILDSSYTEPDTSSIILKSDTLRFAVDSVGLASEGINLTDSINLDSLYVFSDSVKGSSIDSSEYLMLSDTVVLSIINRPSTPFDSAKLVDDMVEAKKALDRVILPDVDLSKLSDLERNKNAFQAAQKIDEMLGFNHYKYAPWTNPYKHINPFMLSYVFYDNDWHSKKSFSSQLNFQQNTGVDTLQNTFGNKTSYLVYREALNNIASIKPGLVNTKLQYMPDPPKIGKNGTLEQRTIHVDIIGVNKEALRTPEKLENLSYSINPWKWRGTSTLHANQSYISNWAGGGENFISLLGRVYLELFYVKGENIKGETDFEFKLGGIRQENDTQIRKNNDLFKIGSKWGYKAFNKWYYSANFDFSTQIFDGYNLKKKNFETPIAALLSPARLYLALGMDYKPSKNLSVLLSPATYKLTYVMDTARINQKQFGVPLDENKVQELGGYVKAQYRHSFDKTVTWVSKLNLFSNYLENPGNIDVDWENIIDYKINTYMSARINLHMKYDDDVRFVVDESVPKDEQRYSPKLQFKQNISFGLSYWF